MSYKKTVGTLAFTGIATGALLFTGGLEAEAASHKVQKGDTLWGLSREFNTSVNELKKMNGLRGDEILIGQVLKVSPDTVITIASTTATTQKKTVAPVAKKTTPAKTVKATTYSVKRGDTFYKIARIHKLSVPTLQKLNPHIKNTNALSVGQKVYVTGGQKVTGKIENKTFSGTTVDVTKAQAILNTGMKYLGTPYKYGAARGLTSVFDCSSFTWYAFKQHGVNLGLHSRAQFVQGTAVSKSDLQPGDLVFFSTADRFHISGVERVGHVGIYMGNGKMLNSNNNGVVISDITSGYWAKMYIGAKRVL